jgi:(p)ppGpp synthase/HD superfamily hydrolase
MHSYAQTNIQLFNQLRLNGYSNNDLSCIYQAYQLTMRLFTGGFRPSGKTFIAHLVGTASILISLRAPTNLVAASLLHAAYVNGDFGDGIKGISATKRQQLRCAVGEEVEEYIARYTAMQWDQQTIPIICDRLNSFDAIDRDVLLIRLANELEEYLDLGIIYCGDAKYQRYINYSGHLIVNMAERLGFSRLAKELETVFQETGAVEIPPEVSNQSGYNTSYIIAPKSYRKRLFVLFYYSLVAGLSYWPSAIVRKLRYRSSATEAKMQLKTRSKSE